MNQPALDLASLPAASSAGPVSPETRLGQTLEALVKHRLSDEKLVLPAMPAAATRCLRLTQDPNFALAQAASTIETDPILAAQIIRLTNSAALSTREPVRSALQAVTRLGIGRLRTFLVESSARQLFPPKIRALRPLRAAFGSIRWRSPCWPGKQWLALTRAIRTSPI